MTNKPWQEPPHAIDWKDEETGYFCLFSRKWNEENKIIANDDSLSEEHKDRNRIFLLGFIAIPLSEWKEIDIDKLEVHGGITWIHTNDTDKLLGFHCGHNRFKKGELLKEGESFDFNDTKIPEPLTDLCYCSSDYIKSECAKLAKQVKNLLAN